MVNFKKLQSSDFLKNVLTMMTGSSIASAFSIFLAPIITRLYTPEEFGVFAVFITIVTIFSPIISFRYEIAIVMARYRFQAAQLLTLSFLLCIFFSLLLAVIFFLFSKNLTNFIGHKATPYLMFAPLLILVNGLFNIINYYNNRLKNYKIISAAKFFNSAGTASIKVIFGYIKLGVIGLIAGQAIGRCISVLWILMLSAKSIIRSLKYISFKSLKRRAYKEREYPFFSMPSALIGALASNLHILLFAKYFSSSIVGHFLFATQLIAGPLAIISSSFSQVFYQKISQITTEKKLQKVFLENTKYLSIISIVLLIPLILVPSKFITFVFGKNWIELGFYLKALGLFFLIRFVVSSVSFMWVKIKKQHISLVFNLFDCLLTFIVIFTCHKLNLNAKLTVIAYSAYKILYYIFGWLWINLYLKLRI